MVSIVINFDKPSRTISVDDFRLPNEIQWRGKRMKKRSPWAVSSHSAADLFLADPLLHEDPGLLTAFPNCGSE